MIAYPSRARFDLGKHDFSSARLATVKRETTRRRFTVQDVRRAKANFLSVFKPTRRDVRKTCIMYSDRPVEKEWVAPPF